MRRTLLLALLLVSCQTGADRVVVGAGTTIVDSGLVDRLAAEYEAGHPGVDVSVTGHPTGLLFELAEQGGLDLVITHSPAREAGFHDTAAAGPHQNVFISYFVLVGPDRWRGPLSGVEPPEAFRLLHEAGQTFVSRGDGSGTHEMEDRVWQESGLSPEGQSWYLVTGLGMGETLLVADQREAVTLAERGAFLTSSATLGLVDLEVDAESLANPYTATVVTGGEGEGAARAFLAWLVSPEGREALHRINLELFGSPVYRAPSG